ncbi:NAD-dependent epimerase/dehydratase family protein [Anabaena cylindrica FACHB-243]|uniref:Hopanoid-associated sugar epimerase n=1 Tax=Anabaena cylindrica (strain ATCC 27899 / PCC 7122) TaxID=272123 RepID=K9Z9D6_ANACC|nr:MULTISPECIES: hopanoid-associated sugar epimerase [Anabaena]AFZ55776.1 hopanoid-associated sugar epimerase [Anabaena cylindrica PCC 7122]MBD2420223.1 NAD-dependent epimerase/dehydratase family protein [Anabaena cylindrica FACHB-243]MBY5283094.1 NAD-dependent epimerase/dehydratase family protein [Anabaena sp. CCAP 1446/1C]MBY5307811.1 NAD-dependent epimerase/dehydratase family protein [Anabaena sp. CCAP 1446/1C]MCM2406125.1 NAD-dependent epimerase/dehydratase family protein [Anabaena sp. CCA
MRAFVTGGTGFVGSHVVRSLLQSNYKVTALVRGSSNLGNLRGLEIDFVKSDLNDPQIWKQMQGCNYLFHVAAHYSLWQKDREILYRHNVEGTRNLLAAAQKAGIERTVYTSSVAAIGVGKSGQVVDETHQSPVEKLVGDYKKSKFLAEQVAMDAAKQGQDIVIVNPSSPIGTMDIKPTPTGYIILRFLRRQMPAYVDTGLNFIDVRDVARGHLLALEKGQRGDRYILGHQNLSLKQLLEILADITGLKAPQISVPALLPLTVAWIEEKILAPLGKTPTVPIDGVRMAQQPMYYDASKAVRELGLPQSPVSVALKDAVDWFVSNGYVK